MGNLPFQVTSSDLKQLFSEFGAVRSALVVGAGHRYLGTSYIWLLMTDVYKPAWSSGQGERSTSSGGKTRSAGCVSGESRRARRVVPARPFPFPRGDLLLPFSVPASAISRAATTSSARR